jgi:hypothetical protein
VFTARYALSPYIKQIRFICKGLSELFVPSWVKDTSSVNTMTLKSSGCTFTQRHKFMRLLVQDVEPSDRDKGVYHPHVEFATPAYATHLSKRQFCEWTVVDICEPSRMFSRMLTWGTTSRSDCTETLGRQPVSRIVWWTRENTPFDGIRRSGRRLRYSSTTARAFPSQNPYTKCMWQYSAWENKLHCYDTSQWTVTVTTVELDVTAGINPLKTKRICFI